MPEQPADIELDHVRLSFAGFNWPPPSHNRPPVWVWAGVAVMLLLALGVRPTGFCGLSRITAARCYESTVVQAPPLRKAESGEQITLPPLDDTDPIVRQLVDKLSSHPTVAAWLTTEGLLLNFVVVTTKIANGETPVIELKALRPIPRFSTRTSGDNRYIDRSSYRREVRFAEAVSALDARGTATVRCDAQAPHNRGIWKDGTE